MNNTKKITIIGAGVSGLIAALELEQLGYTPTIIDKNKHIGGRLETTFYQETPLDTGFQVLLSEYPMVKKYLNLEALKTNQFAPGAAIFANGKQHLIGDPLRDQQFLWATIKYPWGSLLDKFKIWQLANRLKKKPLEKIFSTAEQSTLSYLQKQGFSDNIIDSFFRPFFAGIFLEEKLETSSRMFEFVYKMFANGDAVLPQGGIQSIAEQLAEKLNTTRITLGKEVKAINQQRLELKDGTTIESDIILLTAPHPTESISWKHCENLYFECEQSVINSPLIGLIADQTTLVNNFHFMQDIFPKGKQAILSVTVVKTHKYTTEELQNKVREELKQHCSIEVGTCIKTHKIRYALPKCSNLSQAAKTSQHPLGASVFQAGDYLANASLNAAMASGAQAAQAIHEFLTK